MTSTEPPEGDCARCAQPRPLFPADPTWGRVPSPLCHRCWGRYATVRAEGTFADFNDLFDNGSDEQLAAGLAPAQPAPASGSGGPRAEDGAA